MLKTQFKTYFIISIVLIIGFVFGYIYGSDQGLEQGKKEIEKKYQSKIEELYPAPPEPEEIFSVSGEIKEIKDKILILDITTPPANPFEEAKTEIKKIIITEATEFVKAVQRSPEEIAKENIANLEARKENPELKVIPMEQIEKFEKEQPSTFLNMEVGNIIKVEAEENIKDKSEFTAKKITKLILFSP
jgi:hypothetical protein